MTMRRLIDILTGILVLLIAGPLLLILALAVRLESPGNPFYGGLRVGKHGKPFRIWKFRSMVKNAGKIGPRITGKNDPRITRCGAWLRRTKLDELPQFLNILIGNMTLVGPRPEDPDIVALYTPEQRRILSVKPGITGPSQLSLQNEESDVIPESVDVDAYYVEHLLGPKIEADLEYIQSRKWTTDLRILVDTAGRIIRTVFFKRTETT